MVDAYVGVGSNIAPEVNLPKALEYLQHHVEVVTVSTVYRTVPIGRPEQPDYLNAVWHIRTDISPREVKFKVLRNIESSLGRIRTQDRYSSRTIDLDLLLYGDQVIHEVDLVIPDPDIRERPFITIPLFELNPTLVLPDTKEALKNIASTLNSEELEPVTELTNSLKRMVKYE
jgi:2-amino-4-hydroxy-6-hydroxymethyldihydropteridine diphosphokinase